MGSISFTIVHSADQQSLEDLLWHIRRVKALHKTVATPTRSSVASSSTAGKSLNPEASSCVSAGPNSTQGISSVWARTTPSTPCAMARSASVVVTSTWFLLTKVFKRSPLPALPQTNQILDRDSKHVGTFGSGSPLILVKSTSNHVC